MEKYCTKCKETKPILEFYVSYPSDRKNPKISSYCKLCECEYLARKRVPKQYVKICFYCKKEFVSKRKDATCCSESHRNMFRAKQGQQLGIDIKIKCKESNRKKLSNIDYKYIYNFELTAKEVHKKIKRPLSTIYKLRSRLINPKIKFKPNKEQKILYWNEKISSLFINKFKGDR